MPELPEVETIRLKIKSKIIGKTIKDIKILEEKQFIGAPGNILGKKIVDIQRSGKIINIKLNNKYLNIHLKLTGQLLFAKDVKKALFKYDIPYTKTNQMPGPTTRIIFKFTDGSVLFFNDLRKFGWIKVSEKPDKPKGVDVMSKDFSLKLINSLIGKTKKPIKLLLMDQDKIAGIGNIYANEALWMAKIHPLTQSSKIKNQKSKVLFESIKAVIREGLKYHGSSDVSYILPDASAGRYQEHFKVYGRENQPCPRCKMTIERIKHGGRSSFYCPNCQKQ